MRAIAMALLLSMPVLAAPALAQQGKFSLQGERLVYDTESGETDAEIEDVDVDALGELMRGNPAISTLVLNSGGGSVWAGMEMARIVLDYEIATEVDGECSSACVNIFLAGQSRSMTRGSKIGFHARSWAPSAVESYYETWREDEGWDTPFEFGSWIYEDTQAEIYDDLKYITSRGVDADFAIKTKTPRSKTWYPRRDELERAGVLTP